MTVNDDISVPTAIEEDHEETPSRSRPVLHNEVVTRLRKMIVEGDFEPGARLPEKMLCEQFEISRTPLREAMRVLSSEGLVVLTPNRGATVSQITESDADEMFPIMATLEALAGELACKHITEDQLAEIRALHFQMVLHYRREEMADYFRLNRAIHEKIMDAAANPTLANIYAGLEVRIRRARYLANITRTRWGKAVAEHEEMLKALEARDGPRLANVLKLHLQNKCDAVKKILIREISE